MNKELFGRMSAFLVGGVIWFFHSSILQMCKWKGRVVLEATTFTIVMIILYLLPLLLLVLFNKSVNRHFRRQNKSIKLPDLMVPYLLLGIHILSSLTFGQSIFPYFLIFILGLGMFIVMALAYKKGEIIYERFWKTYWRFIFLFSILTYYFLVGANIFTQFT